MNDRTQRINKTINKVIEDIHQRIRSGIAKIELETMTKKEAYSLLNKHLELSKMNRFHDEGTNSKKFAHNKICQVMLRYIELDNTTKKEW